MDSLLVTVVDDREDTTIPPLDANQLDVDRVVEGSGVVVDEAHPLTVTVYVAEGLPGMPTSISHPADESLVDWHLHLLLRAKRDLTAGSVRAINRAIAREVWKIKMVRDQVDWLDAHELAEIMDAQTAFADEAPLALRAASVEG